jgi:hypothetical protein
MGRNGYIGRTRSRLQTRTQLERRRRMSNMTRVAIVPCRTGLRSHGEGAVSPGGDAQLAWPRGIRPARAVAVRAAAAAGSGRAAHGAGTQVRPEPVLPAGRRRKCTKCNWRDGRPRRIVERQSGTHAFCQRQSIAGRHHRDRGAGRAPTGVATWGQGFFPRWSSTQSSTLRAKRITISERAAHSRAASSQSSAATLSIAELA